MNKNKRFNVHIKWFNRDKTEGEITLKDYGQPLLECECIEDVQMVKDLLNELADENEQLKKEKESWKSNACSLSSLNSILSNELSIAQEQGYEPSKPYKEYIASIKTEYSNF